MALAGLLEIRNMGVTASYDSSVFSARFQDERPVSLGWPEDFVFVPLTCVFIPW